MSHSRKLIVPALFALGVFALAPVATGLTGAIADGRKNLSFKVAGIAPGGDGDAQNGGGTGATDKNGGGTGATDKNGGGTGGTDKNGGGTGGTDKNGGGTGGTDKNGGGTGGTDKNGGGNGGDGKDGGGNDSGGNDGGNGHGGNGHGGNGGGMTFGGGSGGGDYQNQHVITCVINGQLIPVRSVSECRYGPGFVHNGDSYFGGGGFVEEPRYVRRRVIRRRFEANFGYVQLQRYVGHSGGYAGVFGGNVGGYGSGENVYVGSNAAVMQAQRRARESGYGVNGSATYGNNGGYGAGYAYGEKQGYGMRRHHVRYAKRLRHHRQAHGNMGGYRFGGEVGGCNCLDQGYVVLYGPTISKDGGY